MSTDFAQRIIAVHGQVGRQWLACLPATVQKYAGRWGLVVGPPFEPLSYNYVAPAMRSDGSEAVLKLGVPNPLLAQEIAALRLYGGHGAVRLLEADTGGGALLLERLQPGTPLSELADDDEATVIAAATMQQLWRPLPADHPFVPVATWAAGLDRLRARFDGGTGPLPGHLVERAEGLFAELLADMGQAVLLHGDLHHFNIVAAGRQPWLALDPQGAAGEPAYETGALLRNRFHHLRTARERRRLQSRRVALLAERLGFDRQRILAWGMAQAVLSAWWDLEDSTPGWRSAVVCAEDLAALMPHGSNRRPQGGSREGDQAMNEAAGHELAAVHWTNPVWENQAHAWVQVELARLGIRTRGPIKVLHVRPWSTVLQVPTVVGSVYFKANIPGLTHEATLTRVLARWRPDCVPQVLASDAERGWLLMADGGTPLRSIIRADRDLGHWRAILPLYAGLQMEMAAHVEELLAAGAFDRRLAQLPGLLESLVADARALRVGKRDGLSEQEYRRLVELQPAFAADCAALAAFRIPETLQHDDFHDGNILVAQGRYIFFDWAESAVAHPFFTLVVALRSIAYTLGMDDSDPGLGELRDIYLEAWTRYGSRADLAEAFALADRIGRVNRALTWHQVVTKMGEAEREEYAEAVPGWLHEFLASTDPRLQPDLERGPG